MSASFTRPMALKRWPFAISTCSVRGKVRRAPTRRWFLSLPSRSFSGDPRISMGTALFRATSICGERGARQPHGADARGEALGRAYNVGTGVSHTLIELVQEIGDAAGMKATPNFGRSERATSCTQTHRSKPASKCWATRFWFHFLRASNARWSISNRRSPSVHKACG